MLTKNSSHIAGISLGVMAGGFMATLPFQDEIWGRFLQSGFEAGLVGGLADWFAVTALFRHPLGIPIPHTRLLPKNRQKITDSLVSTVETHLLNKASIEEKIGQLRLSEKFLRVVEEKIQTDSLKSALAKLLKQMVESVSLDPFVDVIQREIPVLSRSIDLCPVVEFVADETGKRHYDEKIFDFFLDKTEKWVIREETRQTLGGVAVESIGKLKLNGMMSFAVNALIGFMSEDKLGGVLQHLILSGLDELRKKDNPGRMLVVQSVRQELRQWSSDARFLEELNQWKDQVIGSVCTRERIFRLLSEIRQKLTVSMEEQAFADRFIVPLVIGVIGKIRREPDALKAFEQWIRNQITDFIEKNHAKIGELARENMEKLDDETLIEFIEEKAGKDLQWIRVNGAICGFLIGLMLEAAKWFL